MLLKSYISLPATEVNSKYLRYRLIISSVYHISFPSPKQTLCQLLDNLASCDRTYHLWLRVGKRSQFYDWFPTSIVTICEIKYISHSFAQIFLWCYDVIFIKTKLSIRCTLGLHFFFSKLSTTNTYQRKTTRFVCNSIRLMAKWDILLEIKT